MAPNMLAKVTRSRPIPVAPRPRAASAERSPVVLARAGAASRLTPLISSSRCRSCSGRPTILALPPSAVHCRVRRSSSQAPKVSNSRTPPMSIDTLLARLASGPTRSTRDSSSAACAAVQEPARRAPAGHPRISLSATIHRSPWRPPGSSSRLSHRDGAIPEARPDCGRNRAPAPPPWPLARGSAAAKRDAHALQGNTLG